MNNAAMGKYEEIRYQSNCKEIIATEIEGVTRYAFDNIRIYGIPLENYIGNPTNSYLIIDREVSLVDVAFDDGKSRADFEKGLQVVNHDFGERVGPKDISNIILSHEHEDHWGMLADERLMGRKVYVHQLVSEFLEDHQQVVSSWNEAIAAMIRESGPDVKVDALSFEPSSFPTDYDLVEVEDRQEIINGYVVYHTPGHSLGHICLRVGPILFLGDHMLSLTTPHQSPKSTLGGGLQAYLDSLRKVSNLGVELGLPAHEQTIYPVKARAASIEDFHHQRLAELLELCEEKKNLSQLTDEYYNRHPELLGTTFAMQGLQETNRLLALEEIKAHVEYLLENDQLVIAGIRDGVINYKSRRHGTSDQIIKNLFRGVSEPGCNRFPSPYTD